MFLYIRFGSPFQFLSAQREWGRFSDNYFGNMRATFDPIHVIIFGLIGLAIYGLYRLRYYDLMAAKILCFALPLSSGSFDSFSRYALACLPMHIGIYFATDKKSQLFGSF